MARPRGIRSLCVEVNSTRDSLCRLRRHRQCDRNPNLLRAQGLTGRPGAALTYRMREAAPSLEEERDGVVVDRTYDQTVPDGAPGPGTSVRHRKFGVGIIRNIRGSGPDAKVTAHFPEFGEKTIIARFLVLST